MCWRIRRCISPAAGAGDKRTKQSCAGGIITHSYNIGTIHILNHYVTLHF